MEQPEKWRERKRQKMELKVPKRGGQKGKKDQKGGGQKGEGKKILKGRGGEVGNIKKGGYRVIRRFCIAPRLIEYLEQLSSTELIVLL